MSYKIPCEFVLTKKGWLRQTGMNYYHYCGNSGKLEINGSIAEYNGPDFHCILSWAGWETLFGNVTPKQTKVKDVGKIIERKTVELWDGRVALGHGKW